MKYMRFNEQILDNTAKPQKYDPTLGTFPSARIQHQGNVLFLGGVYCTEKALEESGPFPWSFWSTLFCSLRLLMALHNPVHCALAKVELLPELAEVLIVVKGRDL